MFKQRQLARVAAAALAAAEGGVHHIRCCRAKRASRAPSPLHSECMPAASYMRPAQSDQLKSLLPMQVSLARSQQLRTLALKCR